MSSEEKKKGEIEQNMIDDDHIEEFVQTMAAKGEDPQAIAEALQHRSGSASLFKTCTVLHNTELVDGVPRCKVIYDLTREDRAAAIDSKGEVVEPFCKAGHSARLYATREFIEEHGFAVHEPTVIEILNYEYVFPGGFALRDYDPYGFASEVASNFLDYAVGLKHDLWQREYIESVAADPANRIPDMPLEQHVQNLLDYLNFAVAVALQQKPVQSVRSLIKLGTMLACLRRFDLAHIVFRPDKTSHYGCEELLLLHRALGVPVPEELRAEILMHAADSLGIAQVGTDKLH